MTSSSTATTTSRSAARARAIAACTGAAVLGLGLLAARAEMNQRDIRWACADADHCSVEAIRADGSRVPIYDGPLRSPGVLWHGKDVAELRASCGSPCSISWFFDFASNRASRALQQVIAVSGDGRLAAVAAERKIEVWRMFEGEKPILTIERDFPPVASLTSVVEASFADDRALDLRFPKRSGGMVEERVPIPDGGSS